jgi:hypothetical protein
LPGVSGGDGIDANRDRAAAAAAYAARYAGAYDAYARSAVGQAAIAEAAARKEAAAAVSGAIVQRSSTDDPFATVRYTAGAVLNASGSIVQRTVSLPGGVSVTLTPAAVPEDPWVQAWFYPNLHGDVILQADSAGVRQGVRSRFDPFGQAIDPDTGNIGTEDADNAVQGTSTIRSMPGHRKRGPGRSRAPSFQRVASCGTAR